MGGSCGEVCGVVVVDKPRGMTSFDVVARLRRIYGTRRVGHTGTLDPMATGVLVVLIGRAAKAADIIPAGRKVYSARLRLGLTTDTEDITGSLLSECGEIPGPQAVAAAAAGFLGEYMQTPPMYSAKKRGGEKLYELARRGLTVEREPCRVEVYDIGVTPTGREDEYELYAAVSGGTYIRTLCADIGERLGCGGCMAALRREETCGFVLGDAVTIEELEADPEGALLPTESLFAGMRALTLTYEETRRIRCGQALPAEACGEGERLRLYCDEGFFAVGEAHGGRVRAIRQFLLAEA